MTDVLGVLLISGMYERAHFGFVLATGAAALGRRVTMFATNEGCHAMLLNWEGLADAGRDEVVRARGVAGLDELRAVAGELGVRLLVCEAGLRAADLLEARLLQGVEVVGVASFLEAVGQGQIVSL
jgi:uncharacterized protein